MATSNGTGSRSFYEVFGAGAPTILLMPAWSVVHSRTWKMQVPYLARHYRVVTFDGRGNGRSDRPGGRSSYLAAEYAADALAVMDATGTERAVVVSLSRGASYSLHLAAARPERVTARFSSARPPRWRRSPRRGCPMPAASRRRSTATTAGPRTTPPTGSATTAGFLEFFFSQVFAEPHSTKPIEDAIGWGLDTTPETLIDTQRGAILDADATSRPLLDRVRGPCLVIQGTDDAIVGPDAGPRLADALGDRARLVELAGSGHCPHARDPVKVNLLIRDFVDGLRTRRESGPAALDPGRSPARSGPCTSPHRSGWATPAGTRPSPTSCAGCIPTWRSTGWPSTRSPPSSRPRGEHIHPASAELASESGHIERECADHDLHCFQAWRRMDEILLANFMVFHDICPRETPTTCGSATRPGNSTTTCTRTPSRSGPPTCG